MYDTFIEVQMWELTEIVIPKIKTHWDELAFSMRYGISDVEAFDKEGKDLHERCKKLFVNWLTTNHGPEPKTYEILLQHIKKVSNLTIAAETIEKELIESNDKQFTYNIVDMHHIAGVMIRNLQCKYKSPDKYVIVRNNM